MTQMGVDLLPMSLAFWRDAFPNGRLVTRKKCGDDAVGVGGDFGCFVVATVAGDGFLDSRFRGNDRIFVIPAKVFVFVWLCRHWRGVCRFRHFSRVRL